MTNAVAKAMTWESKAMSLFKMFPDVARKPLMKIGVVHGTITSKIGKILSAVPKYKIVVIASGDRIYGMTRIGFKTTGKPNVTVSLMLNKLGAIEIFPMSLRSLDFAKISI